MYEVLYSIRYKFMFLSRLLHKAIAVCVLFSNFLNYELMLLSRQQNKDSNTERRIENYDSGTKVSSSNDGRMTDL